MHLDEAIKFVLEEHGYISMNLEDITAAINQQNLYVDQDGSRPDARQIGLIAVDEVMKNESPKFEVLIRLR